MTKRAAKNQMTKENCLNEDEEEEAGHFEPADSSKLQNRNFKKAKRRLPEDKNRVPCSPFSQFAGFVGASSAPSPVFSFGAKPTVSNGNNSCADSDKDLSKVTPVKTPETCLKDKPVSLSSASGNSNKDMNSKTENVYLENLKQLNMSFMNWIQENMNRNAFCDFTPVCMDYVEHMKGLEKLSESAVSKTFSSEAASANKPQLFKDNESSQPKPFVSFSFLTKGDNQKQAPATTKPFTFSSGAVSKTEPASEQQAQGDDDDDNYVPPKTDFQPVAEPDALYSKRCKLFFKDKGNFVDQGIGMLYVKELQGKFQLLMRADNSQGTVLLNIALLGSLPTERLGKNNVLIVCTIDPTVKEPTPVLFRVKTTEDADDLLENLNKYKSKVQC